MAGGTGDDGVANGGEQRTGIEFGKRLFGIEAEGAGAGDRGGIGDGAGGLRVAVDAIRAGAENGETLAGMVGEIERAGQGKLLIAATAPGVRVRVTVTSPTEMRQKRLCLARNV